MVSLFHFTSSFQSPGVVRGNAAGVIPFLPLAPVEVVG